MSSTYQFVSLSGNVVELGTAGSQAVQLVLLCGVANGSVVVPVAVSGNGAIFTSA